MEKIDERHESESETDDVKHECCDDGVTLSLNDITLEKLEEEGAPPAAAAQDDVTAEPEVEQKFELVDVKGDKLTPTFMPQIVGKNASKG